MKVTVSLTLDVDRETWCEVFGLTDTAAEFRDDIRSYILTGVQNSAAATTGAITSAALQ